MNSEKSGAMLVVGGGIAGIQAALDLAESGYYVYLVEKSPAIGGVMAQLVPLGVVTGGRGQKRLREALLKRCHWLGAYAPPGDLFPGALLGLALVVLQARGRELKEVLEEDRTTGKRVFRFVRGPVFAHLVLADEINRTPPKTQAALLQAMQERSVSVGSETYELPVPFFVLATQNPIEQEGTYPLPEAQLDRFMFALNVDYPSHKEELTIALETTGREPAALTRSHPRPSRRSCPDKS